MIPVWHTLLCSNSSQSLTYSKSHFMDMFLLEYHPYRLFFIAFNRGYSQCFRHQHPFPLSSCLGLSIYKCL